jgi:hypothetical protein
MTEATKPYALRLLDRCFIFDPDRGVLVSREFIAGSVVTDPADIALLESRGASVEKIEMKPDQSHK